MRKFLCQAFLKENEDLKNDNGSEKNIDITKISLNDLNELIEKRSSFVLVISSTYCSHCAAYLPIFGKVVNEKEIKSFDIDIYELSSEEKETLKGIVDYSGTPTTVVFKDGVVINSKSGKMEENVLIDFLKENNVL